MMSYSQWGNALYAGEKSYQIVQKRKIFVGAAVGVMILAAIFIGIFKFNPSIEFSGGSQFTINQVDSGNREPARNALEAEGVAADSHVISMGSDAIRVQTVTLDESKNGEVKQALVQAYNVDPESVDVSSVGASWGADITKKALRSTLIFVVLVTVMMAVYFRSWTMSAAAMIAMAHDIALTVGFFALFKVEVSPASVIGFLTILGYSLYDTVVVFDKIRELTKDVHKQKRFTYGELVNLAVNQTLVRSLNTSIAALLPIAAILVVSLVFLGAGTLTDISLALFVGILAGTYSSIFVASPLLVVFENHREKTREHNEAVAAGRGVHAETSSDTQGKATSEAMRSTVKVAPLKPGRRLSNEAQPNRRKRRK